MQMLRMVGVAGPEHGLERPAGGARTLSTKIPFFSGGVSSTAMVVPSESVKEEMSSALPKACSDSLRVPLRGRQT